MTEAPALEIRDGIWLVRLPLPFPIGAVNVYLLRGRDGFLLIDCGLKTQAGRETLARALSHIGIAWTDIRQILVTHLHPDHFGLAAQARRLSGAAVLMHRVEAAWLSPRYLDNDFFSRHSEWLAENGVPPEEGDQIARASRSVAELIEMVEVDRLIEDGEQLPIAGGALETVWTPGHSPGLVTFYFAPQRLYFSSDHMLEKITPNIGLHRYSAENPLADYLASLDRLKAREIDLILPGHGQPFQGHREWIQATEEHHRDRCRRMLEAVADGEPTAYQVVGVIWGPHLSPMDERFAVAETLAHLEYLRRQGQVESRRDDGVVRWRAR